MRRQRHGTAGTVPSSNVRKLMFRVQVNYDELLEVKVGHGFAYANSNLTDANFSRVVGHGLVTTDAVFVNFGEHIESEDAVARLDEMGLRAGVPKELADSSKAHPNSPEFAACLPAVALGDSWQGPLGDLEVACLGGGASGRGVVLDLWRSGWGGRWWFLAFRK